MIETYTHSLFFSKKRYYRIIRKYGYLTILKVVLHHPDVIINYFLSKRRIMKQSCYKKHIHKISIWQSDLQDILREIKLMKKLDDLLALEDELISNKELIVLSRKLEYKQVGIIGEHCGRALYYITRLLKPYRVIETGVAAGLSQHLSCKP